MDERNRSGQPEDGFTNDNDRMKRQESSNSGSSYYYSYGPFQSLGKDNAEQHGVESHNQNDVEIAPPNPIRPLPTVSAFRSTSDPSNAGNNGDGAGGNGNGNWQFNQKPKTSMKTIMISFLAGVVVIAALMFTSDRMNLFTSKAELSSAEQPSTTVSAAPESSGNGGNTSTTSLPLNKLTDVSGVVEEAGPAVVKIETLVKQNSRSSQSLNPFQNDPFSFFFGDQSGSGSDYYGGSQSNSGSQSQDNSRLIPYGIGSGFIYNKEGYILTNEHVIENADVIQVNIENDSKTYEAKLLGKSKDLDLAVLKIEGKKDFPVVPLGDSSSMKVGQPVVAIGNPQGFDHTVTTGVLSARERSIDIREETGNGTRKYQHLLQTDASINPGNSGGPLLNLYGQVIGMNVAVSADSQGIGFAIPTSTIKNVVQKLESNQEIPKDPVPFIGAKLMTLTDEVAKQMQTDVKQGVVVADVYFKTPAYEADLRPYDIITGANGTNFNNNNELVNYIQKQKVGSTVTMDIIRNGKKMQLTITVGDKNKYNIPSDGQQ
ncbi:trypsin-like peptidase domain-containing protein [Paenibacillus sp.]|jgi:S1-C subfamily serine protease|uniref:S1C family serine protease n=1 Tax=Paenibacillus sp. TaxID=58172 RepID=UPI002833527C|nr:trypsin-like peptidase domain-containing protein [Paenibacillus sp.]MDR0268768.1 trypsin-like peptidase domain-containing protein [Paenibacillus sp.]